MSELEQANEKQAGKEYFAKDQGAADPAPSGRKRKTQAEKIEAIDQEILKHQQKLEQLKAKKARVELTPDQKKELKRKTETHCKIVAGVEVFELCKFGNESFTIENFKKRVYSKLKDPQEISFLDKQFKKHL